MRFHLGLISKAKRFLLSSPAKTKPANGENPVGEFAFKSNAVMDSRFGFSEFGSKEEIFFDSKAWLDSDCEDDFYSVNGDSTPWQGDTPKHHFSAPPTPPQANKSLEVGKKKLFDLLQETAQQEDRSPCHSGTNSVWSSEATPGGDVSDRKERIGRSKGCCFPGLKPSLSFSDRRRLKMSPVEQTV